MIYTWSAKLCAVSVLIELSTKIMAKQVYSGALQLHITIMILVILYCKALDGVDNCDECIMVHRYINASGDNYVTFKPTCLEDSACPNYCRTKYKITAVAIFGTNRGERAYWRDVEVLLVIPESSEETLEPHDIGMKITYICYIYFIKIRSWTLNVTVRLKPLSVKLHITNNSHGEIEAGQSTELDCVISAWQFNVKNATTAIHFVHKNNTSQVTRDLPCTYKASPDQNLESQDAYTTVCATKISTFSQSDSGKYYCTVVIGEKSFQSKMKDIGVVSKGAGQEEQSDIITISAAIIIVGLLLAVLILLVVSVAANIYLGRKVSQNGNGNNLERVPLVCGGNGSRDYGGVAEQLDRNGHGRLSSANSDGSENSRGSGGSHPDSHMELPHQEGNSQEESV